jgi:uncharacterized protein (TIGR02466 family)
MNYEDTFEEHFPTTVMTRHHESLEQLNQALLDIIVQLEEQFRDTDENAEHTVYVTTQGGYQTLDDHFLQRDNPAIRQLRDDILTPAVRTYVDRIYGKPDGGINFWFSSWANILHAGDWQSPHFHSTNDNLASGVYYVRVPEKPSPEGCIEFINPNLVSVMHHRNPTRRIKPKEGDLLIFPPYYMHFVHPFRGDGARAIVSFDAILQRMQFTF